MTGTRKDRRRKKNYKAYRRKQSYSTVWLLIIMFGTWYMLFGKDIMPNKNLAEPVKSVTQAKLEGKIYTMPCTQANIAKILSYTLIKNESSYAGTTQQGIWYNKYYDALKSELNFDYLKKEEALKGVTYTQVAEILNHVLGEGYGVNVEASTENLNKNITLNQFIETYTKALEHTGKGIVLDEIECVIVATPATYEKLGAWKVATEQGEYGFEGIILDSLRGQTVKAIVKNKEILAVTYIMNVQSVIKQCYILKVEDQTATIQMNNIKLVYDNTVLTQKNEGTLCNITLQDNTIVAYEVQENKNTDRLVRITKEYIELEKAGRLSYQNVMVYDRTPEGSYMTLSQLPYGIELEYTYKDNQINSIQIVKKNDAKSIRVVLSTGGGGQYTHQQVQLSSTGEYNVVYNGATSLLGKEEVWDAKTFPWKPGVSTIRFVPKTDTMLTLLSLKKQDVNPGYKGTIEVSKEENGFYIVNELDMESYVAGVIPSEMPTSYGEEAAKVQAIAARTYALASKQSSKYIGYGAHIDDTTDSQVYLNVVPTQMAYDAAAATKGQVLKFNDVIISSKFFAASCGYTANFGEVWAAGETFPTNTPLYLVSRQQYVGDKLISDMRDEKEAYKFFTMAPSEVNAFDQDSAWFRWQVKLNSDELAALINPAIYKITRAYPSLVKVLSQNQEWVAKEIDTIGKIKSLEIKKRGSGGNIMELIIVGDKDVVKVSTEYLIRSLFSTNDKQSLIVTRADTLEVKGMSLLPSAFFSMDTTYNNANNLSSLTLYGGGFGHGVGMSQDGVKGMGKRGYTYREILKHYYPQIEIKEVE